MADLRTLARLLPAEVRTVAVELVEEGLRGLEKASNALQEPARPKSGWDWIRENPDDPIAQEQFQHDQQYTYDLPLTKGELNELIDVLDKVDVLAPLGVEVKRAWDKVQALRARIL